MRSGVEHVRASAGAELVGAVGTVEAAGCRRATHLHGARLLMAGAVCAMQPAPYVPSDDPIDVMFCVLIREQTERTVLLIEERFRSHVARDLDMDDACELGLALLMSYGIWRATGGHPVGPLLVGVGSRLMARNRARHSEWILRLTQAAEQPRDGQPRDGGGW